MDVRNSRRQAGRSSVITANSLRGGQVVWLGAGDPLGDGWRERIEQAAVVPNDAIAGALERAATAEAARIVIGVYGVEIDPDSPTPVPVTERERIRAAGPSVRTDLGPQAELAAGAHGQQGAHR